MLIGLDFDNTLVSYDHVWGPAAVQLGLLEAGVARGKRDVRDRLRRSPGGDLAWQRLQGLVYGPRMGEARLMEGAGDFIRACRVRSLPMRIVSHKTEYAGQDPTRTRLPDAALRWMEAQGFFASHGLGFARDDVYFERSRAAKVARIRSVGCTHFVDDLEETFLDPGFPHGVARILYAREPVAEAPDGVAICRSWKEIHDHVLGR